MRSVLRGLLRVLAQRRSAMRATLLRHLGCGVLGAGSPCLLLEPIAPEVRRASAEALSRDVELRRDIRSIVKRFDDSFDPEQGTSLVEHAFRVVAENEAMRMRLDQVRLILAQVPTEHRCRMVRAAVRMLDVELSRLPSWGKPE